MEKPMGRLENLRAIDPGKIIVFDTETTGISTSSNEILQLSIIDGNGTVLFDDLIKPERRKSWNKAQEIHGISPADVKAKQTILERRDELEPIFKHAKLYVGYNVEFDLSFLRESGLAIPNRQKFDVMEEFAKIHGEYNEFRGGYKPCKLVDCAAYYDLMDFDAHDSMEDVRATLHCFNGVLDDPFFGERRPKPKKVEDEFGDVFYEHDEYRNIVESGYAEDMKRNAREVEERKCNAQQSPTPESIEEKMNEADRNANAAALIVFMVLAILCFVWWVVNPGFFKAFLALVFVALFALSAAKNLRRK